MRLLDQRIPQADLVDDNIIYRDDNVTYVVYNGYVFVGDDGKIYLRANSNCKIVGDDEEIEVARGEYRWEAA